MGSAAPEACCRSGGIGRVRAGCTPVHRRAGGRQAARARRNGSADALVSGRRRLGAGEPFLLNARHPASLESSSDRFLSDGQSNYGCPDIFKADTLGDCSSLMPIMPIN